MILNKGVTDGDQGSSGSSGPDTGGTETARCGLTLGQHFNAHVTALYLIAEPFCAGAVGYHLPDEVAREHLRHAEAEAETVFAAAREAADSRGVVLETRLEAGGLDRLPIILARNARNADLVVVGEPDPANNGTDDALLVEAAFMETGRPALVVPYGGVRAMPPGRSSSPGMARARRPGMTPCRCCAWRTT